MKPDETATEEAVCPGVIVFALFVWFDSLFQVNNFSVMSAQVFLGWTSIIKQGLIVYCSRTQHSDASEARARSPKVLSQALYHWVTESLRSHIVWNIGYQTTLADETADRESCHWQEKC